MRVLIRSILILVAIFGIAGCSSLECRGSNGETACQEELESLLSDQPGFVASPWCDATFVRHLEAVR